MKADKVIFGNIYTVDRKQPKAGAVAIAGGKFVCVGDDAGVVVTSASDYPVENPAYPLTGIQKDITACDPEQIADTKVLRTMVCGEWVYIN